MATFKTKNGVKVTFDNNYVKNVDFSEKPPLLVFDDDLNLKEVNFDGYVISGRDKQEANDEDGHRTP